MVSADGLGRAVSPVWGEATRPDWLLSGVSDEAQVTGYDDARRAVERSPIRVETWDDDTVSVICRVAAGTPEPVPMLDAIAEDVEAAARRRGVEVRKRWSTTWTPNPDPRKRRKRTRKPRP